MCVSIASDGDREVSFSYCQPFMSFSSNPKVVIDAMEEKIFAAGTQIIKQGDDGDYLFVIEEVRAEQGPLGSLRVP